MKGILMVVLPLFTAVALVGCGQSGGDNASKPKAAEQANAAAPEVTKALADDAVQAISVQALAAVKPGTAACAFDSVDGSYSAAGTRLDRSNPHVFRGWALTEDKHAAKAIEFVLKGANNFAINAKTGVDRQDVGSQFKDTSLDNAGFNFSTTLKTVPAGDYHVLLVTKLGDVSYSCETKKSVTVF